MLNIVDIHISIYIVDGIWTIIESHAEYFKEVASENFYSEKNSIL
jgi:hypothetical protein